MITNILSFFRAFLALFIITDIFGNLPIFIGLTDSLSKEERKRAFTIAIVTAFIILCIFALFGNWILSLYSITIADFKVAGGILLLALSLALLLGEQVFVPHDETVGAVPLGSPLLTGPGAITTAIFLLNDSGLFVTFLAIVACFLVNWLILWFSDIFYEILGKRGSRIIKRIMSIIIAAIAVQYIREGILGFIR